MERLIVLVKSLRDLVQCCTVFVEFGTTCRKITSLLLFNLQVFLFKRLFTLSGDLYDLVEEIVNFGKHALLGPIYQRELLLNLGLFHINLSLQLTTHIIQEPQLVVYFTIYIID